jgi:hypothetical protein
MQPRLCAIVGLAISLGGCASGGVCTGWAPIYISKKDTLTDITARSVLAHNEYGRKLGCAGFKPK